jgi:microcystin-dependent protein
MNFIVLTNENQNLAVNNNYINPVGVISCYAGITTPDGWLLCNGSEVSKNTYNALYSVIGDIYGTPADPVNNFVLPDLRLKFPLGKSGSNSLGDSSGNSTITLTTDQLPSHTHSGTTAADGVHNHTGTTSTDGTHNHTSNAVGGIGGPGLAFSDNTFTAGSIDNTPGELNLQNTLSLTINDNGAHSHSLNINNSTSHTHTFTTNSTGSGSSINIMNPYIVINYIIKY